MDHLRWLCLATAAINLILNMMALPARSDGIDFNTRLSSTTSSSQTTLKSTSEKVDSDFNSFDQRYNLDLSKSLFPYLTFSGGAFYQSNKITTTSQNLETEIVQDRISPYLEMNLSNPFYKAGLAYRKTEVEEQTTGLPKVRSDRDQYIATMGMSSMGLLPRWNMVYSRSITSNEPETVDQQQDLFNFTTQYTLLADLNLDYAYTRTDNENRLQNYSTTEQNHFGRITYGHSFLENRLSLNTGYSINYNTLEFPGTATVDRPLLRSAGLSSQDTTPTDGPALVVTPALIDGNLSASAGLDIGQGGDESTFTNIGLDFGFAVDVNIIRIWVDRRLTDQIANSFAWSIYASPDNLETSTWTLVATVAPASFGVFDNRFEITFPSVNTRFIKVVVRPLLPSVPGASTFPNIFITEMEALISQSGVSITNQPESTNQNFNFNVQGRLGESTTLGYNLYYTLRTEEPADQERDQVTNGLFLNHVFNPTFSASASIQRSDESDLDRESENTVSSIALRAVWLRTLNQILSYSQRTSSDEAGDAFQNSLILRTNANLYHGWDVFLDLGYNWDEDTEGNQSNSRTIKGGTDIVPLDKLTINLNYAYKQTEQEDLQADTLTETQIDLQGFYVPFPNLSLFAKISVIDKASLSDTLQNYSINWSPFAQGDLQFYFAYYEILRSESHQTEKNLGPGARWTIGRHVTLDLSYSRSSTENEVIVTDTESYNVEFKLNL